MPGYPWLETTPLDGEHIAQHLETLALEGVPYTKEMIDAAQSDLKAQGTIDSQNGAALLAHYPKAIIRDLGADKGRLTEADAVIAYLQRLGTQVDFKLYDDKANIR
jgi:cytochrome c oxidase cbb3-type subunit 2